MDLSWIDFRFVGSLIAAIALAVWGFRTALSPGGRGATAIVAACALLILQAALYWRFTVDDAFIAFRFARNWASGLGPIYQSGERVEGYTCFLWISLLSLARQLGFQIELTAKVLGISSAIATLPAVYLLVRTLGFGERAAKLAPLLLASSPLFAAWAVAGMDAPLFAAILSWAMVAWAREDRAIRFVPVSALLLGLLVIARPEGLLFSALALGVLLLRGLRGRDRLRRLAAWGLTWGALVIPYWIWRWRYYGAFFPNTFYAKTSLGAGQLYSGLVSIGDFAASAGALTLLLVLLAVVTARSRWPQVGLLFGSLAGFLLYVVLAGGDILHLRFYVHVLPLWMVCAAIGLDSLIEAGRLRWPPWESHVTRLALALGFVWMVIAYHENARALSPRDQFGPAYIVDNSNNIHHAHIPLGDWLRVHVAPGSHVVAADIGGLGYQSDLSVIDLFGLTDRALAGLHHRRASNAELAANVRARNPELMALYGSSKGPYLIWLSAERAWVESTYRRHSFWPDSPADKGLVLLVRNDIGVPAATAPEIDLERR